MCCDRRKVFSIGVRREEEEEGVGWGWEAVGQEGRRFVNCKARERYDELKAPLRLF